MLYDTLSRVKEGGEEKKKHDIIESCYITQKNRTACIGLWFLILKKKN